MRLPVWQSFCDGAADTSAEVLTERQTSINIRYFYRDQVHLGYNRCAKRSNVKSRATYAAEGSAAVHPILLRVTESGRRCHCSGGGSLWYGLHFCRLHIYTSRIFDPRVSVEQIIEPDHCRHAGLRDHMVTGRRPSQMVMSICTLRMVETVGTETRLLDQVVIRCCRRKLFGMTEACGFLSLALPSDPVDTHQHRWTPTAWYGSQRYAIPKPVRCYRRAESNLLQRT